MLENMTTQEPNEITEADKTAGCDIFWAGFKAGVNFDCQEFADTVIENLDSHEECVQKLLIAALEALGGLEFLADPKFKADRDITDEAFESWRAYRANGR